MLLPLTALAVTYTAPFAWHGRAAAGRAPLVGMGAPATAFNPRLVFSEVALRLQRLLDPDLVLHKLPSREIVSTEADVYAVAEAFPEKYRAQFVSWYEGYRKNVLAEAPAGPGLSEAQLHAIFNAIVDRMLLLSRQPYVFSSRHAMLEAPYDYFEYGHQYVQPLVDYSRSYLRNPEHWLAAKRAVEAGENVVLLANHQSETDAAFLPLFFDDSAGADWRSFGRRVHYVAGDRVVADPIAQPFSMGRNLFCVHSKKYIETEPDSTVRAAKRKQNKRTLMEMSKAFKEGGVLVWVAPARGRDRPTEDGRPTPAEWDPAAVEMFRSLGAKSGRPMHLFPMAMATYAIMPPPDGRNQALGEQRVTCFSGTALSLGAEVDLTESATWRDSEKEPKQALCDHVFDTVCAEYDLVEKVMAGFNDGEPHRPPNSVQPWTAGAMDAFH